MKQQRASGKWQVANGEGEARSGLSWSSLFLSLSPERRSTHVARKVFYQFGVL